MCVCGFFFNFQHINTTLTPFISNPQKKAIALSALCKSCPDPAGPLKAFQPKKFIHGNHF